MPVEDQYLQGKYNDFGINAPQTSVYEEEQERELSPEVKREREVQRPSVIMPHKYIIDDAVRALLRDGTFNQASTAFISVFRLFKYTSAALLLTVQNFNINLQDTQDFCKIVKTFVKDWIDDFLRPVNQIVRLQEGSAIRCIIISSYKANEAVNLIRQYRAAELASYSLRTSIEARLLDGLYLSNILRPADLV